VHEHDRPIIGMNVVFHCCLKCSREPALRRGGRNLSAGGSAKEYRPTRGPARYGTSRNGGDVAPAFGNFCRQAAFRLGRTSASSRIGGRKARQGHSPSSSRPRKRFSTTER